MIQNNYSLKSLNTFGIDVLAKYFAEFTTLNELQDLLQNVEFAKENKLILGGGSNILFTKNFDGLVLKNNLKGIDLLSEDEEYYYVKAQAGEVWHNLVLYCIERNYGGLENLSLIPGSVGASPIQNIGAYGVEMKDCFYELEAYHILEKQIVHFTKDSCQFAYRDSIFKNNLKGKVVITAVTFRLPKKTNINTSYGAIEKELASMNVSEVTIKNISDAVCNIRRSKLPNTEITGNAGSFFKNPEISNSIFKELKNDFPTIVSYPLENGNFKLAAGWLIEQCNWKGKKIGNAGVHSLQALVLINLGKASGAEIFELSTQIIYSVKEKFGVELEREVNII
jgi:UDP-N-acetylmuramate dehydrogenase